MTRVVSDESVSSLFLAPARPALQTIGERYYRGLRLYILDRLLVMFNNRPQHREDFARTMREVFREQIAVVKAESTGGEEVRTDPVPRPPAG